VPLSVVLVNLFHFFLTFTVLIPALLFFNVQPGVVFFFLVVIIFFQALFVLGLTFIFSAMNVYYRDVRHFLEVMLQLWFWVTPIIWSIELIPERFRDFAYLNPFTPFVTAFRDIILYNRLPGWFTILLVITIALVTFLLGTFIFHKKQRRFAEEI